MKTAPLVAMLAAGANLLAPPAAEAGLFRAYLSSTGNDTNPCTVVAPCRLLPAALAAINGGGEIWMLDSANFNAGTVAIDRSVTLLAVPGALGSLVSTGAGNPALDISTPGLDVTLRNVSLAGLATAAGITNGIRLQAASNVLLEDSVVANFSGYGLSATGGTLTLANVIVRNIPGNGLMATAGAAVFVTGSRFVGNGTGLWVTASGGGAPSLVVAHSVFANNATGARTTSTLPSFTPTFSRTTFTGSTTAGLVIDSPSGGNTRAYVGACRFEANPGAPYLTPSNTFLGSVIYSFGDNVFVQNGATTGTFLNASDLPAGTVK